MSKLYLLHLQSWKLFHKTHPHQKYCFTDIQLNPYFTFMIFAFYVILRNFRNVPVKFLLTTVLNFNRLYIFSTSHFTEITFHFPNPDFENLPYFTFYSSIFIPVKRCC